MFYKPELIIYLWLLPITVMIVIPAVFAAFQVVMSIMKKTAAKKTAAEEEIILDQTAFSQA